MKLTNKAKAAIKPGMTLIELTVVIIVLLTLISVLFFAGTAYIKASNRTACVANQATIQKAVRGAQSLNQKDGGSAIADWTADIVTPGYIGATLPKCPTNDLDYTEPANYPIQGTRAAICPDGTYGGAAGDVFVKNADPELHIPSNYTNW